MNISRKLFEAARVELSAMAFNAALRHLCRKTGWDEKEAILYLCMQTGNIEEVFIQAKEHGTPTYLVNQVINALAKKGVVFHKHQLRPNVLIIENHAMDKTYRARKV